MTVDHNGMIPQDEALKEGGKDKSPRGTIFEAILYPDDPKFKAQFEAVQLTYDHVYILHNRDVIEETGELKKEHYHVLIKCVSTTSLSTIAYTTQIPKHQIRMKSSYMYSYRYLIHADQPKKAQYSREEIQGVKAQERSNQYLNSNEAGAVMQILTLIDETKEARQSLTYLGVRLVNAGLWGYFRQAQSFYLKVWQEPPLKKITKYMEEN